jgi:hypothetical protein
VIADSPTGHEAPRGDRTSRSTWGWLGLLVGPTAWALQLIANWAFGEVIACSPAARPAGAVLGVEVNAFNAIVNVVLLALTVVSGVGAVVELRRLRSRRDETPGQRATWLATAGVMTAALFALLIAVSFIPLGLIQGCDAV